MHYLNRINHCFALLVTTAFILPLCLSSNAEAQIEASYQFSFDQTLVYLNGIANRTNLAAAINEAGDGTELKMDLEASLKVVNSDDLMKASMWRYYSNVLMGRKTPGVFFSNSATSNSSITSVEITLSADSGEFMPFNNGDYIQEVYTSGAYYYFPDLPSMSSDFVDPDQVSSTANVLENGKRLVVDFENKDNEGILPGRATTFNVYSSLGINLEDFLDDNTLLTVTYKKLGTDDFFTPDPVALKDIGNIGAFNASLTAQSNAGLAPGTMHFKENVVHFDPDPVSVNSVPEPSGIALVLAGLAGMSKLRRRRNR